MDSRRLISCCLINNYNYGDFVCEAVDSALQQTLPFDEVVVVDDGSTDGSQALLDDRYANDPRVKLVFQANGGQLSAFHAGLAATHSDVVFFLDADDRLLPSRCEETLGVFERAEATEAVFVPVVLFGQLLGVNFMRDRSGRCKEPKETHAPWEEFAGNEFQVNMDHHCLYADEREWIGSPTSGLAVRRQTLAKFLPLSKDLEKQWRIRADDVLVFGLAATQAHRVYLHRPLVEYRVHSRNAFFGNAEADSDREQKLKTLFAALQQLPDAPGHTHESVHRQLVHLWDTRTAGDFRTLERLWRFPRKKGMNGTDRWKARAAFIAHLLGVKLPRDT